MEWREPELNLGPWERGLGLTPIPRLWGNRAGPLIRNQICGMQLGCEAERRRCSS